MLGELEVSSYLSFTGSDISCLPVSYSFEAKDFSACDCCMMKMKFCSMSKEVRVVVVMKREKERNKRYLLQ